MENRLLMRYPLGNPHRIWRQDNFILSAFCPGRLGIKEEETEEQNTKMRRAVKTCVDAGFNLLELGWASPERGMAAVWEAEKQGIGIIYQNLKRFGAMGQKNVFCEKNDLPGAMEELGRWKSVRGFYLYDEPWYPEQMQTVRKMMDYAERVRPDLLPFTVALPSNLKCCAWHENAREPYVENFVGIIDPPVLSFDYYPIGPKTVPEHQADHSRIWCDIQHFSDVARSRKIPFWFYYEGQNLHNLDYFIFPMVRMAMHAALLYGPKALQHYTPYGAVVDEETCGKGIFFEEQKEMNARMREWGNTLMAIDSDLVVHDSLIDPVNCPAFNEKYRHTMAESTLLKEKELPRRCSIAELSDAYGNRYLMVLNRDYEETQEFSLKLKYSSRLYEISREDGLQYVAAERAKSVDVRLEPGELAFYRVQRASEKPFTIEYMLDKTLPDCIK